MCICVPVRFDSLQVILHLWLVGASFRAPQISSSNKASGRVLFVLIPSLGHTASGDGGPWVRTLVDGASGAEWSAGGAGQGTDGVHYKSSARV